MAELSLSVPEPLTTYALLRAGSAPSGARLGDVWHVFCEVLPGLVSGSLSASEFGRVLGLVDAVMEELVKGPVSERHVEAGLILATIISRWKVGRRAGRVVELRGWLGEALAGFVRDYYEGVADFGSSPILSAALGLAVFSDDLVAGDWAGYDLRGLFRAMCVEDFANPRFCVYGLFSAALRAIRDSGLHDGDVGGCLERIMAGSLDRLSEELLVLLLLSLGILRRLARNSNHRKELYWKAALEAYMRLIKIFSSDGWKGGAKPGYFWRCLVASLRLNYLDRLRFLPASHIPVPEKDVRDVEGLLKRALGILNRLSSTRSIIIEIGSLVASTILPLLIPSIKEYACYYYAGLALVAAIVAVLLLVRLYMSLKNLLSRAHDIIARWPLGRKKREEESDHVSSLGLYE